MGRRASDPLDRYLPKVDRRADDECWPWTAARFQNGYGAFRLGDKQMKAHRFGYAALIGPIPAGRIVCHTCDNPPCQNPAHWFLGDHGDNARDRTAKGRGATGLRNGGWQAARFTPDTIREIRLAAHAGETHASIGRRLGADQSTISTIVRRDTWAHTDLDLPAIHGRPSRHRLSAAKVASILVQVQMGRRTREQIGQEHGVSRRTVTMLVDGWRPSYLARNATV